MSAEQIPVNPSPTCLYTVQYSTVHIILFHCVFWYISSDGDLESIHKDEFMYKQIHTHCTSIYHTHIYIYYVPDRQKHWQSTPQDQSEHQIP